MGMSAVIYAKDDKVIKPEVTKKPFKRTIELNYFTKAPLTIYQNYVASPDEKTDTPEQVAMYEKKALATAGEYLALVCTSKTRCSIQSNPVLTRKERVWAGYSAASTYPNGTNDGVVAWVKKPLQGAVLFINSNLPTVKKCQVIKTWYANLDALKAREQTFNPEEDYPTEDTTETITTTTTVPVKKKYKQTIALDNKQQVTVVGKTKEKSGSALRIDWFVKFNNTEKKLTFMEEPVLELSDMSDVSDYLLWVGDLDGDNQPDFIINNDSGWGELEYKLFLSTDIKPNKPWQPAARFDWWSGSPHC